MMESQADEDRSPGVGTRIQSLARGCRLLLWIAAQLEGATAKEVAFANGLGLATTYHILNTLIDEGLLEKGRDRRYRLGPQAGALAEAYARGPGLAPAALAALGQLAHATGETAYLAAWDGEDLRLVAAAGGRRSHVRLLSAPYPDGHARANGKALLALAPPEVRRRYVATHGLPPRTDRTIGAESQLDVELDRIRARGYATDDEEFATGLSCIAAPLRGPGGVSAAIGVSLPTPQLARRRAEVTAAVLAAAAASATSRFR